MTLPERFEARMRLLLGDDADAFFDGYRLPLRRGLRVNTLCCDTASFCDRFPLTLTASPFASDAFYLDENVTHKAGADPLHHAGAYYMQEPSAASAVTVLTPMPGEHILDLCAAPGGKSTQIAAALCGEGLLWCNEYVKGRAAVLCQNMERMGVRNAVVSCGDTTPLCDELEGCFDAVLADVPCSGEGMFRKEEVALSQWSEALVDECAERGAMILHNASKAVRAGGRLVYSTCTFAPEENEMQILRFLQTHPDFELCPCGVSFGRAGIDIKALRRLDPSLPHTADPTLCRRIFPADGGEGHFIALLKKRGDQPRVHFGKAAPTKKDDAVLAARRLWDDCFTTPPNGDILRVGDTLRLVPPDLPVTRHIHILQAGVAIGTVAKNRIEPHHALFASCSPTDCRRTVSLPADDPRTFAFLHGEEIDADGDDGYTAVLIDGVPCGFGKVSRGRLKNKYPKGLRLL